MIEFFISRSRKPAIRRSSGCGTVRAAGILLALSAALFGQVTINEFNVPTALSQPSGITSGPDGNLWFAEGNGNKIGRITPGGVFTEFPIPTPSSTPIGITSGPDGNLWFAEGNGNKIGRITPGGVFTEFPIPTPFSTPIGITGGPDGNLWFTEQIGNNVGRITTGGVITEFALPAAYSFPVWIASGPDGNLWFTEQNIRIGRITPGGALTEFTLPETFSLLLEGITSGPDGNLWFTENVGKKIGRITTGGVFTEFPMPPAGGFPFGVTSGPDSNLWFTDVSGNMIGRITTGGVFTEFPVPTASGVPRYVTSGPDGNLWFTEYNGNKIGQVVLRPVVVPPALAVSQSTLSFAYQTGGAVPGGQSVSVGSSGTALTFSTSANTTSGGNWLSVTPTGATTPATLQVSVAPAGLPPGTYNGTITISSTGASNSPQSISVALTVSAAPLLTVNQAALGFAYQPGGAMPGGQSVSVGSSGTALTFTASATTTSGGNWLSVTPTSGTTPASLGIFVNPAGLAAGTYFGNVTISSTGASNSPRSISVALTVSAASALTVSQSTLGFAYQPGGAVPGGQSVSVGSRGTALTFTASATTTSGGNWLSVTPTSGTAPASLGIFVNPAGLAAGTYFGNVTISSTGASNSPQSISVTLTVSAAPALTVSQSTLSFFYQPGGAVPGGQNVSVGSSGTALTFTASATTTSGGNWLSVTPASGTAPASLGISVNPAGLAAGTYFGNVTIASTGASNSPQSVSVALTVTRAATISVSPSLLSFAYQSGGNPPQAQAVTVSATSAAAFTAAASGDSWLSVSPASGPTPANLSVSVNPAGLNPGTYNGTITVTGANGAQGVSIVSVALAVTAPPPTINGVTNAASYATGAISPGELITIFGTAIGPPTPAYAITDPATGKLATAIGGVQVFFNGIAAPMIYASSTQVSAVVPYEMAGIATPLVWIKYAGQTSNGFQLTSATTAPGLFTQNSSGSGPGAIQPGQQPERAGQSGGDGQHRANLPDGRGPDQPTGRHGRDHHRDVAASAGDAAAATGGRGTDRRPACSLCIRRGSAGLGGGDDAAQRADPGERAVG